MDRNASLKIKNKTRIEITWRTFYSLTDLDTKKLSSLLKRRFLGFIEMLTCIPRSSGLNCSLFKQLLYGFSKPIITIFWRRVDYALADLVDLYRLKSPLVRLSQYLGDMSRRLATLVELIRPFFSDRSGFKIKLLTITALLVIGWTWSWYPLHAELKYSNLYLIQCVIRVWITQHF